MIGTATGSGKRRRPRTCAGCGEEFPRSELLRIVRSPDGKIAVDPTGRAPGRGVYLCRRRSCLELARKKKQLSRSLRSQVTDDIFATLSTLLEEIGDGSSSGGERP
ncbi:MAG TPA: DUF448 domain-containing protein [Synergistaceae bacterium]|jgi:predicted RNA-binding protein YlxR (DUF448 family)|nr:MAG: Putative nucleic-acid-binding protein implicated in transcription termination [Synergistales bacterium 57_84]KUK88809.1 MAG: Putative nucleic-acid-binding protein implicated in transcription termination [Synergistales bacterium 58_81]HBG14433.1 DUF448 domain-containing protein [Synergistaceae bacterium]HCP07915.1 DUF448 domain-containing protein [Synergistaceae bacterium]HCR38204.1 DUF448 domain-containing protein [Synergistaceae bacterium]